ncbi:MAG: preprotein translocase subunit SecG [Prevotella sp.]|nr:preprotein translocase subunit SecG [Prevotella sp.]
MYTLFVIFIVLAALLMIGIVLIQESKGGGLSSNFASSNQIMGVRKTTDFIEKATWGLAIVMVVLSVICAYVAPHQTVSQSTIEKNAIENPLTNPKTQQNFGTSQPQQAAEGQAPAAENQQGAQAPAQDKAAE